MSKEVQRLQKALENNEQRITRLENMEERTRQQEWTLEALPKQREGIQNQITLLEDKGVRKRIGVVAGVGYNSDILSTVWESYEDAVAHITEMVGREPDIEYVHKGVLTARFDLGRGEEFKFLDNLFSHSNATTEMDSIIVRSVKFGNFPIGSYEV